MLVLGKPPINYEHSDRKPPFPLDIFWASAIWRVWPWQQFSLCKNPLPFPFNRMDPFATSPLSLLFSGGVATIVYCLFSLMCSRLVRLVRERFQPWRIVFFVCLDLLAQKVYHVTNGKAQNPNFIECRGTHQFTMHESFNWNLTFQWGVIIIVSCGWPIILMKVL